MRAGRHGSDVVYGCFVSDVRPDRCLSVETVVSLVDWADHTSGAVRASDELSSPAAPPLRRRRRRATTAPISADTKTTTATARSRYQSKSSLPNTNSPLTVWNMADRVSVMLVAIAAVSSHLHRPHGRLPYSRRYGLPLVDIWLGSHRTHVRPRGMSSRPANGGAT